MWSTINKYSQVHTHKQFSSSHCYTILLSKFWTSAPLYSRHFESSTSCSFTACSSSSKLLLPSQVAVSSRVKVRITLVEGRFNMTVVQENVGSSMISDRYPVAPCSGICSPVSFSLAQPAAIGTSTHLSRISWWCVPHPSTNYSASISAVTKSNVETRQLNVNVTGHRQHAHTNQQLAQEVTFNWSWLDWRTEECNRWYEFLYVYTKAD